MKYLTIVVLAIGLLAWAGGDHQHESEETVGEAQHEDGRIHLDEAMRANLNLGEVTVVHGRVDQTLSFPAEVEFDASRVAHLTPRVSGMVDAVHFGLGDRVRKGEALAELQSRELGMAKADYQAALARTRLLEKTYQRYKSLWEKKITAELPLLEAEQNYEEALIELRNDREVLVTLGMSDKAIHRLETGEDLNLNRYMMQMPFDGVLVRQHISLGEVLSGEQVAFTVVDPSRMWIMARVPERDIRHLRKGLKALVSLAGIPDQRFEATLDYVSYDLDRETRTAEARLVLANPDGLLRAGMMAEVSLVLDGSSDRLLVPKIATQRTSDGVVVFVKHTNDEYEMVPVTILREGRSLVEVSGGLQAGMVLATGDLFILKSEAGKEAMGGGHSH